MPAASPGRAVDAGVRPTLLPAIEIGLRLVQALEAQSLERSPLGVADSRFDLALAIAVVHSGTRASASV
jgi:hypothetical protein